MDVAMNLLSGQYLAAGLEPELIHRLGAVATAGFSCLPHNGMQITIMDTCGYTAGQCYKYIFYFNGTLFRRVSAVSKCNKLFTVIKYIDEGDWE